MPNYFGMVTITAGQRAIANVGPSGLSGVLLGNESGLSVTVTLDGCGQSRRLYPGTVDFFEIKQGFNGNVLLDPTSNLSNLSSWPSSYVDVDTFGTNERPQGIYPIALPRNTNVGNTISTVGGTASSVQNDANASGTSVVEATVVGDGASAITLSNAGIMTLGTAGHNGSLTVVGSNGLIKGQVVEAVGHYSIDDNNGTARKIIDTDFANNNALHTSAPNGVLSVRNSADNAYIAKFDDTLALTLFGKLNLLHGLGISGLSWFGPYTGGGGAGTSHAHNLGVRPDLVLLQIAGSVSSERDIIWDDGVATDATNIKVYGNLAGVAGNVTFYGIALKF